MTQFFGGQEAIGQRLPWEDTLKTHFTLIRKCRGLAGPPYPTLLLVAIPDMFFSGYSDQFTGLVTSLFLFCGTFAALPVTIIIGKLSARSNSVVEVGGGSWKNPTLIYTKVALTVGAGSTIGMLMLAQVPGQQVSGDNRLMVQITFRSLTHNLQAF